MLIIPAIDIIEGKVSRLSKGEFDSVKQYDTSVLDYAKIYDDAGFELLHIVDLKASVTGIVSTMEIIRQIKINSNLKIEFGGGIKSLESAKIAFESGVDRVVIGSISVTDKPEFARIISKYDADKIVVASDTKDEKISVKGWTENTEVDILEHIEYCRNLGLKYFLCTDISKDGMLQGTNVGLYKKLQNVFPDINVIASGGVSGISDLIELKNAGLYASVIGKAIYENKVTIEELKSFVE